MNKERTNQPTQLQFKSPICDVKTANGVLYFTVNLRGKGKQRWQNNGIESLFVGNI